MLFKNTPIWIASKNLLAERGGDFFRCMETAVSTCDPEDIHDLRVASRRLREGLSLFRRSYPQKRIARLRKSVRKVTDILGDMRNIDEYLAFLREEAVELGLEYNAELSACIERYQVTRRIVRKKMKRDLRKLKPGALRTFFGRTIHAPHLFDPPVDAVDPFLSIGDFARDGLDERLASVLALIPAARNPEETAAQHRLRIAVKRYRYRMEVLAPLMGDGYAEEHARVKSYQEILGRIHDLDVFSGLIPEIGFSDGTAAALAVLLADKRAASFREFRRTLDAIPLDEIGSRVRSLL